MGGWGSTVPSKLIIKNPLPFSLSIENIIDITYKSKIVIIKSYRNKNYHNLYSMPYELAVTTIFGNIIIIKNSKLFSRTANKIVVT